MDTWTVRAMPNEQYSCFLHGDHSTPQCPKCGEQRTSKPMDLYPRQPEGVTTVLEQCAKNTDREIWREREGDYYADSIHATEGGGIGMSVGGYVIVKPIREWFLAAWPKERPLPYFLGGPQYPPDETPGCSGGANLHVKIDEL